MKELRFDNNGVQTTFVSTRNFVIVGANGSGKSHLGAAIEYKNPSNVLRISAQRALNIPDSVNIGNYEESWRFLMYGSTSDLRKGFKWGWNTQESTIRLVNDYQYVLSAIFSKENDEMKVFTKDCRDKISNKEIIDKVPDYITDRIEKIWDEVFPQRKIVLDNAKATAKYNEKDYEAKYMSDGERVALYLIAQCLLAPAGTFIVVDEPEIHLHRTIMNRLWDKIEEACPEDSFIYITHDLEFAAGRKEASKIWVKEFDGKNSWVLQELPEDDIIPDDLMMEVFGNRKPVLFVEGDKTSYDFMLYRQVYEEKYVIPVHNCYKVIELTKAFNSEKVKNIHNLNVKGIIDRDYLSQNEIDAYKNDGVETLNVAEVENLYLLEPVLRIVAEHLALNANDVVGKVQNYVFSEFVASKDVQLKELCSRCISFKLQQYVKPKGNTLQDIKDGISNTIQTIEVDKIYREYEQQIDEIIAKNDYLKMLSVFNRKSLHKNIAGFFGLTSSGYPNLVLNLLKTEKKKEIVNALKSIMPSV